MYYRETTQEMPTVRVYLRMCAMERVDRPLLKISAPWSGRACNLSAGKEEVETHKKHPEHPYQVPNYPPEKNIMHHKDNNK